MLPDLAAGTLASRERDAVVAHADVCRECREWLDTYETLSSWLGSSERNPESATAEHPDAELLARWAVAPDQLSPEESTLVERHLADCTACSEDAALVGRAVIGARSPTGSERRFSHATLRRVVGLAAGVVGIAVVAWVLTSGGPSTPFEQVTTSSFKIENRAIDGTRLIEVPGSLTVSEVSVGERADVTLKAVERASFGSGFRTGAGARLVVVVEGDSPPKGRRRGT